MVPRDVLPWLRDNWWAGLAVLGGIILLAVLLNLLPRSRAPHNSGQETPTGAQPPASVNHAASPPPGDTRSSSGRQSRCESGQSACGQGPRPSLVGMKYRQRRQMPPLTHGIGLFRGT